MPRGAARVQHDPILGQRSVRAGVEDFEKLRLLLKNKCQNDSAVVGDVGETLAKLMEVFELHVNTRCGQSSEGIFPLPPSIRSRVVRSPHPLP